MSDPREISRPLPGPAHPRVLAVDDQADSRRLLELQLRAAGFLYTMCADGASALAQLRTEDFDVVILDVMMPEMDGYETCRRIKEDSTLCDIPVIFLTAKMDTEDKVRGLNAGGHDYLNKPVSQLELVARTRAALRTKTLQDDLKKKLQLEKQLAILHQEQLSQHWERTLGQLATSLAHEINNPLTAALGSIHILLSDDNIPADTKHHLDLADFSLQRAAEKMRHFLRITESEREPEMFPIAEILRDVLALLNYRVIQESARLNSDLDETLIWKGQRSELGRIILYLLSLCLESARIDYPASADISLTLHRAGEAAELRIASPQQAISLHSSELSDLKDVVRQRRSTAIQLSVETAQSLGLDLVIESSGAFVLRFPKVSVR